MKIQIKHRITNAIIVEGDYESRKDCLEKNQGVNLQGANLQDAVLQGAVLQGVILQGANLRGVNLQGANLQGAVLQGVNLQGAVLQGANLQGAVLQCAVLQGANLRGVNLQGAVLQGAEEYAQSHDFFAEIVKRQSIKIFTTSEWKCIAVISIHRICWDTIKKQFGETAMSVFKKLSKAGFDEWEKYYKGFCK